MDANDDVVGSAFRRSLGDKSAGGETPESLMDLADAEARKEMTRIATQAGYESADAVLAKFDGKMDGDTYEKFNRRLNSGTPEAAGALRELVGRLAAHDEALAQEASIGFENQADFIEASEKASLNSSMGRRDASLDLRIANTGEDVIQGRRG